MLRISNHLHGHRHVHALAALPLALLTAAATAQPYRVTRLVSDGTSTPNQDENLVNGWGIAFNPQGFVWVADNGSGMATLYDGNGVPQTLIVAIPSPDPTTLGAPTGIVFSGGSDFSFTFNGNSGPARFMWATEDGTIAAWNPNVDLSNAHLVGGNTAGGAIYKGLALASTPAGDRLYATDFHNGHVDVFDGTFAPITAAGGFTDPHLPDHFAPFGIQAINGKIFVTFAMQDAERHDEVDGLGLGFVDEFDTDGNLIARVASRGALNAPWGIAMAPHNFGPHGDQLLIGNFGDGRIHAFRRHHSDDDNDHQGNNNSQGNNGNGHGHGHDQWVPAGVLRARNERPIVIDGLWGMGFGNGLDQQPTNTLFFAAGPGGEHHGLYGRIDFVHH
jgi:uncharacterized protein (TIGR03118 family)